MQCLNCNKELTTPDQKKFCCRACAATYNNLHRKTTTKGKTKTHICIKCGKEFVGSIHLSSSRKICHECGGGTWTERKKRFKKRIPYETKFKQWLNGEDIIVCTPSGQIHSRFRSEYIKYKNGKCEICGWNKIHPITGLSPLEIHHIDGDCFNNSPGNLQLLCPNCHSLTENFGARNKNCRKKYYIIHK